MEEQTPTSCKNSVMSRIECEGICPRSKGYFATRECAVWILWLVSVVVGALAVAVTIFVVTHRQYGLFEATHDSFWGFMIEVLPFLWIVVFGLMVLVGVYNLRHTKRGYRYPLWQIFLSSFVLSLAGGAVLQFVGVGYATDHVLGQHMRMYNSQEKIEEKLWQKPEDGRLIGHQVRPLVPPAKTVDFVDVEGTKWFVDVTELAPHEMELLNTEDHVRLIGVRREDESGLFYSCGVFPWLLDKPMSRDDLFAARRAFETKVHGYKEEAEHMLMGIESESEEADEDENPCAHIRPVRRFELEK